jgi:hypothetical protein
MAKKRIKILVDITDLPSQGGHARAKALGPEGLSAAGSHAVKARWDKYYRDHPEKLKAKLAKRKKAPK